MIGKEISVAIANLINHSIQEELYPKGLKKGTIRPVYKKGKREEYANYRPITLLPSIDKIVEKYIAEQVHNFFKKTGAIYHNQFGFQKGKGTTDLLLKFTDEINGHLNDRKSVLVLFIGLSRAFDTLNHNKLIEKLDDCCIRGPLLSWCKDYLRNRSFSVRIDNAFSDTKTVLHGTAQGSVLGPLYFLAYVNDMNSCITYSTCYQFADDTCLVIAENDLLVAYKRLQSDFDNLAKWCHDAGLVLNRDKTKL